MSRTFGNCPAGGLSLVVVVQNNNIYFPELPNVEWKYIWKLGRIKKTNKGWKLDIPYMEVIDLPSWINDDVKIHMGITNQDWTDLLRSNYFPIAEKIMSFQEYEDFLYYLERN